MIIRKGDKVIVLSGNERGKSGKVLKIFPATQRAIVEGVNFIKRHSKPSSRNQQGGIIEKEASVHMSNLRLVCPGCGKASGVKRNRDVENRLVRECKSCGEVITVG